MGLYLHQPSVPLDEERFHMDDDHYKDDSGPSLQVLFQIVGYECTSLMLPKKH